MVVIYLHLKQQVCVTKTHTMIS